MSDQSKAGIIAVSAILLGLSTIVVGGRFFARRTQHLPIKADDVFALLSLLCFLGVAICNFILADQKLLGYSSTEFTPERLKEMGPPQAKLDVAWDIFGTTCLACTKLSALFFYRRIFCVAGQRTTFDIVTKISIVVVVLWLFVFDFLGGFQCGTHFSALWDGSYVKYCTISFPFLYGLAVSDFLLDIWLLVLPIPEIMKLNTTASKKASILGVFILAFAGLGASIARMVQYITIENGGKDYFLHHDMERAETKADFMATLEAGISLVAVNLPSLWLLFTSVFPGKAMAGLRSMISLASIRSGGSGDNRNSLQNTEKGGPGGSGPPSITRRTELGIHRESLESGDVPLKERERLPRAVSPDLEAYKADIMGQHDSYH